MVHIVIPTSAYKHEPLRPARACRKATGDSLPKGRRGACAYKGFSKVLGGPDVGIRGRCGSKATHHIDHTAQAATIYLPGTRRCVALTAGPLSPDGPTIRCLAPFMRRDDVPTHASVLATPDVVAILVTQAAAQDEERRRAPHRGRPQANSPEVPQPSPGCGPVERHRRRLPESLADAVPTGNHHAAWSTASRMPAISTVAMLVPTSQPPQRMAGGEGSL
mmetsp:Transcript_42009/g.91717  ORF Transcript_42009/g.91717 Transcript_42009/m.91717 type:complete len:220 (-) Transcript_42009:9-668(-)